MIKFWLKLLFPLGLVRYADEGGGGEGAGAGDGVAGAGGGEGTGAPVVQMDNSGVQSRELNPDGNKKAAPAAKAWYETPGVLSDPKILTDKDKEYKSVDELVKGFQSARQLAAAKGIPIPAKDATPDQQKAFRAEVMKHFPDLPLAPDSADAYELEMFKQEDLVLSSERQKAIKGKFHELGIGNKQANGVMELYKNQLEADMAEAQVQLAANRAKDEAAIKQAWGAEYQERMDGVNRLTGRYPELMAAMKTVGFDGRKDFIELMDEVVRSVREDHPGGAGRESGESLDGQIKDLRVKIKGTENIHERQKLIKQQTDLYKKKGSLNKK